MTEEQELQSRTRGTRLFQLDALRGIAAVCVVFYHFRYAFHMQLPHWPLIPVFAGHSAVVLFFVLSGYVLSLPYWEGRDQRYLPYLVRRFFRIYVPFFFAALLSIAGAKIFYGARLPLTPCFYMTWQTPVSLRLIVKQMLMSPTLDFNTALWSLRYEMQMSIAMPLLCFLMRRNALLFTAALGVLIYGRPAYVDGLDAYHVGRTIQIAFQFALGAMIARYRFELKGFFEKVGNWAWLVLAGSLLLYYAYPLVVLRGRFYDAFLTRQELCMGIGATGVILCSFHVRPFARALQHPVLEYFGSISYSLYLVHSLVIFASLDLLYGRVPFAVLVGVVLAGSVGAAQGFYRLIEKPSMFLGKRLSSRL